MIKAKFTCSCYDPPFYESFQVKAEDFDEAWDKAKKKAAKKYNAHIEDVAITSSYWEQLR